MATIPESAPAAPFATGLTTSTVLGAAAGLATDVALWASYPPAKHMGWVPAAVVAGSALVVVLTYVPLAYHDRRLAADRFVLGYITALVLFAGMEVAREAIDFLQVKAPGLVAVPMRPVPEPLWDMGIVAGFASACGLLVGASYLLWCLDLLPRTRRALFLAGLICLGVAVDKHGFLFGSQVTPAPVMPQGIQ